jgi:hypothetical protein
MQNHHILNNRMHPPLASSLDLLASAVVAANETKQQAKILCRVQFHRLCPKAA